MSTPSPVRRMQYTFMEAEEILDELPDIEDDPTPNSLRTRNLTMILVDGIYDRLQTKGYVQRAPRAGRPDHSPLPSPTAGRADSPGSQEDILQDESPLPAPKQRKKKKKKTKQQKEMDSENETRNLVQSFLSLQGSRPLQPGHILELLSEEPTGVRREQVKGAVKRLLGGIQWTEEEAWVHLFRGLSTHQPITFHQHFQASADCNRERDLKARLHKRQEIISNYIADSISHRIIQGILVKIDWIRFARDYNNLPANDRSAWLNEGYIRAKASDFLFQTHQARQELLAEHRYEVNAWKKEMGRDTTARNRLYELFLAFGAIVLLDPVWNIQALKSHNGSQAHVALVTLAERIQPDQDDDHPLTILQPSIEHALVCIVDAVAGSDAAVHVNNFLDEFSDDIAIPRLLDY